MRSQPTHYLCAVALACALGGVSGLAPRAEAQAVYSACYVPSSGTVYRINEKGLPQGCTDPSHVEFKWNEQGPPGPQGPVGPPGPQGPQGPAGGLSGFEMVASAFVPIPYNGGAVRVAATCPQGKVALGGGFELGGSLGARGLIVATAGPNNSASVAEYAAYVLNDNPQNTNAVATVWATCAYTQ